VCDDVVSRRRAAAAIDALTRERPAFHVDLGATVERRIAGQFDWSIGEDVLRWLAGTLRAGWTTLETGVGYSTVVFAAAGCRHTAISPDGVEHASVREWCTRHSVPLDHARLIAAPSQDVVHGLAPEPLDVILIDGDHAFPAPFIDWYYTAERLRCGGALLVDDTQLATGTLLRTFLVREEGRWRLECDLGKTAVFRRVTERPVARGLWWGEQPWAAEPPAGAARHRLASRLRALVGRSS
jgi:predicted O-methyltransferase YrrM